MKKYLYLLLFLPFIASAQAPPNLTQLTTWTPYVQSGTNLIYNYGGSTYGWISDLRLRDSAYYTTPNYFNTHIGTSTAASIALRELLSNKATSFGTLNNTLYPTTQAVANYVSGLGYGTVTSVSGVATNGFTWSIANPTTTPALTLTLQNATTAQSGQLTSTDWNMFNGKQAALGFTPENVANKTATQSSSTTTYPNWLGVTNYVTSATGNYIPIANQTFILGSIIGMVGDGVTDNKTILQNAINSGYNVLIGKGKYFVSDSVKMKEGSIISGMGDSTIISTTGNHPIFSSNGNKWQIRDLSLQGDNTSGSIADTTSAFPNQHGISVRTAGSTAWNGIRILNVTGLNLYGALVFNKNSASAIISVSNQNCISSENLKATHCYKGYDAEPGGEYNNAINFNTSFCGYGIYNAGGNNTFVGGNIEKGYYGYYLKNGFYDGGGNNDGHCQSSSLTINHNLIPIYVNNLSNGYKFSGISVFGGNIVYVTIPTTSHIDFVNSTFGVDTIKYINTNYIKYVGGEFFTTPVIVSSSESNTQYLAVSWRLGAPTGITDKIINPIKFNQDGTFIGKGIFNTTTQTTGIGYYGSATISPLTVNTIDGILYGNTGGLFSPSTGNGTATYLTSNLYYNGGSKYITSDAASQWVQNADGSVTYNTAPTGTPNAAATLTQRFKIDISGNTTAASFIKNGATSGNLLTAGGGDIPQSTFALSGASLTIGSTNIALGGTATTIAGLTSLTSTSLIGALTGNASTATSLANTRTIWGQNFNGSANVSGAMSGVSTISASGLITSTVGNNSQFLSVPSATTGYIFGNIANTGGSLTFGVASSAGVLGTGTDIYAAVIGNGVSQPFNLVTNNTNRFSISGSGNFDFKSGTMTVGSLSASQLVQTDGSKVLISTTALPSGTTATTQSALTNNTTVGTTAYTDAAITALKVANNTWTANNSFQNAIYVYNGGVGTAAALTASVITAPRTLGLPDASGTIALTSNLPIHGNSTTTGTATTVVTVTIGTTQANTSYFTKITPRDLLTAVNYYISAQTTTTFDVTFVSALTGSINFDWEVTP